MRPPVQQFFGAFRKVLGWLSPGLGVKRWLIPILFGTTMLAVGLAVLILDLYRTVSNEWLVGFMATVAMQNVARPLRALIFGLLGTGLIMVGVWGLNRSLLAPYQTAGRPMLDMLSVHRRRDRGPKIVALGGGHGQANLLRGLKQYSYNLTAVVTVADDGGSSGRLRRTMGVLPPGDIRNCLAALSDDETMLSQLFQYRFPQGDESGLHGHSFGNLFITALGEITGSFEQAVVEAGRVLAVHGQVLPATLQDVRLVADVVVANTASQVRVTGESNIPDFPGKVRRLYLEPNNPPAYPTVIKALLAADMIVVGPGSLYTSLLPNLLVPDISAAIRSSRAIKVFVCNLATQHGETDHYSAADHLRVLSEHLDDHIFDVVLVNNRTNLNLPADYDWVLPDKMEWPSHQADLVDEGSPWRHDPQKLAKVLIDLYEERTGPLVE